MANNYYNHLRYYAKCILIAPSMADLLLQDISIAGVSRCHLRRSSRARRMRIELRPDCSLLVVIPAGIREDQWLSFVLSKKNWIIRKLRKYTTQNAAQPVVNIKFPSFVELLCSEQVIAVSRIPGPMNKVLVSGESLDLVCTSEDDEQAYKLLRHWLVSRARKEFTARLQTITNTTGLEWNRLSIRGQKTRWGSCSARADISLNFKLLFLPAELVDHVLLHELVHTKELNHSQRFWALMKKFDPYCNKHRAELRNAGRLLPDWLMNI